MNILLLGSGGREHALAKSLYESPKNKKMFYIPEGFAHGYLVLSEFSIVLYKCTNIYDPKDEYGIKWNDPDLNIKWGKKSPLISEKDNRLPNLKDQMYLPKY